MCRHEVRATLGHPDCHGGKSFKSSFNHNLFEEWTEPLMCPRVFGSLITWFCHTLNSTSRAPSFSINKSDWRLYQFRWTDFCVLRDVLRVLLAHDFWRALDRSLAKEVWNCASAASAGLGAWAGSGFYREGLRSHATRYCLFLRTERQTRQVLSLFRI